MFDFKFDWSNDIDTGIKVIDEQHKELFRIGREIEQLIIIECQDTTIDDLRKVIGELRDYVSYHFYEEERLMIRYNYGRYEKHKKNHDIFKAEILKIDFDKIDKNTPKKLNELKIYIQDWIFNHMITEDQYMAEELNKFFRGN